MTDSDPQPGPAERDRAVRHVAIDAEEQGQRLDKVLGRLLAGVPRSRIFRLIRRGEVRVNGRRAGPEQRLAAGDRCACRRCARRRRMRRGACPRA